MFNNLCIKSIDAARNSFKNKRSLKYMDQGLWYQVYGCLFSKTNLQGDSCFLFEKIFIDQGTAKASTT